MVLWTSGDDPWWIGAVVGSLVSDFSLGATGSGSKDGSEKQLQHIKFLALQMWSGSTRSAPWSHQDAVSWRLRPCMPQRAPVLGFLNDNPQSWVSKVDRKINCNHKNTNNSKLYIENRHNTAEWFWSPLMMFGVADGPKMLFWTWNRWILALERDRKTSYTWLKMSLGRDNVIPDQIKTANCGSLSRILDNDFEETTDL